MSWVWHPIRAFGARSAPPGMLGSRPLRRRIGRALAAARRQQCGCLLFRLQLSGLDALQQQHGEAFVEGASRVIAERVHRQIRGDDLVTRIAGEEFALLAQGVEGSLYSAGETIAERITESLTKPYGVDSVQFTLGLRIGIAGYPDNATDAAGLLLAASQALHAARRLDHDGWRFASTLIGTSNRQLKTEPLARMNTEKGG